MKQVFFASFLVLLFLSSCQKISRTTEPVATPSPPSFLGPFVTPADDFFRSLSITYVTAQPESTRLQFSMTGDIDWQIDRPEVSTVHNIVFKDVEEEVMYSFLPKNFPSNHITTVQTVPYTKETPFSFAVVRLSSLWTNRFFPAFSILMSENNTVSEEDFLRFYHHNHQLVHRSILYPTFSTRIRGKNIGEASAWHWFSYGKSVILVIKHQMPTAPLFLYLSDKPDDENFIIAVDFSPEEWRKLLAYENVAHLINFNHEIDTLSVTLSADITTLYSYKK